MSDPSHGIRVNRHQVPGLWVVFHPARELFELLAGFLNSDQVARRVLPGISERDESPRRSPIPNQSESPPETRRAKETPHRSGVASPALGGTPAGLDPELQVPDDGYRRARKSPENSHFQHLASLFGTKDRPASVVKTPLEAQSSLA